MIATSLALPYPPDFGWISMVLVHEPYRRRGLATKLLIRAVDHLRANGLVPMLDATPTGRVVYSGLGFADVEPINRWHGTGTAAVEAGGKTPDFAAMAQLDASAFGADRHGLLYALAQRPGSQVVLDDGGYALTRRGRAAVQLGPIVAKSPETSLRLFQRALQLTVGPMILDVPERASDLSVALDVTGFVVVRRFTRMALARSFGFGTSQLVAAIAGPELG